MLRPPVLPVFGCNLKTAMGGGKMTECPVKSTGFCECLGAATNSSGRGNN